MGMLELSGSGVYRGVAFGKVKFLKQKNKKTAKYMVEDVKHELERFEYAKKQTLQELDMLFEKALKEVGNENALIFDIHKMMVEDLDYNESVKNIINEQKVNAEYAVNKTCDIFAEMFSSMDDEYMRGRAADVKDISKRIITNLSGEDSKSAYKFLEPVIVAADLRTQKALITASWDSLARHSVLSMARQYVHAPLSGRQAHHLL